MHVQNGCKCLNGGCTIKCQGIREALWRVLILAGSMAVFWEILRKEFLQLMRHPWLFGALAIFVGLVRYSTWKDMAACRKDWINQETRSVYMAKHHGTIVHNIFSLLLAFDLGVDPHLRNSVRLESRNQQPMAGALGG